MSKFLKIISLLSKRDKKVTIMLTFLLLFVALIDSLGVASIMPFVAILSKPALIENNVYLAHIYNFLSFENHKNFLFFLTLCVLFILIVSSILRAFALWATLRYTFSQEHILGMKLIDNYLSQPYEWFLNRHSADLGKFILSETEKVIQGCLLPLMIIISHGSIIIFLFLLLIFIQPMITIYFCMTLAGSYGIIYLIFKNVIAKYSLERVIVNKNRFEILNGVFGGIKDIKLNGTESVFINAYRMSGQRYAHLLAQEQIIGQTPKYIFESVSFGGMLLVTLYLISSYEQIENAIPFIALFAFAGYKIMPSIQQVYFAITRLQFASSILDEIEKELSIPKSKNGLHKENALAPKKYLQLKNISYKYPSSDGFVLQNLNLKINSHTTVGIVGKTGSGKTTLIDLILGLLIPKAGSFFIDDKKITSRNLRAWQNSVGYVSQNSFFVEGSVLTNIAFGISAEKIDRARVEEVAKIANIHDFITSMPYGYNSHVGERGVRLSGGQKQRIAIARALYREPKFLILDEATSSLDTLTEKSVMESIRLLSHKITIVIVAHRLNTLKSCDVIYEFNRGKLFKIGNYSHLLKKKNY